MPSSHFPDAGSASTVVTEAPILGDGSAGDPVSFDATDITVGTNKQIIFNDSGVLAGNAAFTFDKATGLVGFTSGHGLAFAGAKNPITAVGGDEGSGDTTVIWDNPTDSYIVFKFNQFTDFDCPLGWEVFDTNDNLVLGATGWLISSTGPNNVEIKSDLLVNIHADGGSGQIQLTAPLTTITGPVVIDNTIPFAYPTETGTPGSGYVSFLLGGLTNNDTFMQWVDAQPGDDDTNPNRDLVIYARPATALHHIAGASLFLYGSHWNGASSDFIGIEIENKVRTTGLPELWLEQSGGHPFMRFFWDQSTTGIMAAHDQDGYVLSLRAYDVDGAAYKSFIALQSANTPTLTIAPPSGGTVSIQSTTYKSSDGTTGATAGIVVPTVGTLTFKNGLYVGLV